MKALRVAVVSGLMVCGVAPLAQAADPEEAIEYRQGIFEAFAWNFGPMGAMVKGKMPYDQAVVTRNAKRLAMLSDMPWEAFTEDSDFGDTDAKPEIWSQRSEFESRIEAFEKEAGKLAEVAAQGDRKAFRTQFGEVAKACKGCHDDFREDD